MAIKEHAKRELARLTRQFHDDADATHAPVASPPPTTEQAQPPWTPPDPRDLLDKFTPLEVRDMARAYLSKVERMIKNVRHELAAPSLSPGAEERLLAKLDELEERESNLFKTIWPTDPDGVTLLQDCRYPACGEQLFRTQAYELDSMCERCFKAAKLGKPREPDPNPGPGAIAYG